MHERSGAVPQVLARLLPAGQHPSGAHRALAAASPLTPVQRKAADCPRRSLIAASPRGNDSAKEVQIMICSA